MTIRTTQLGGGGFDGDELLFSVAPGTRVLVKYVSTVGPGTVGQAQVYWLRSSDSRIRVVHLADDLAALECVQGVELYSVGDDGEELRAYCSDPCFFDVGGVVFDL